MLSKLFRFLFLLISPIALAQSTVVSVNVVDTSGQVWANGTISYQFAPNPNIGGTYQWNGAPLPSNYITPTIVNIDGSGNASFTLPTSTAITPAGSSWQYTFCPNASTACSILSIPTANSSQNISSLVTSGLSLIKVSANNLPKAYADSEVITTPAQGGQYYNTSTAQPRYFDGTIWHSYGGSGSSLPTATSGGQIISSSAAGTTYAVQGNVFYQQNTDTLTSIAALCSNVNPCTYIVTNPQDFGALSSNVSLPAYINFVFYENGSWAHTGSKIIFNSPINGTLSTHFKNTGPVAIFGGGVESIVPVEWFGAVGDGNITTGAGTDNTIPIQAAIDATVKNGGDGGHVLLQDLQYKITGPLVFNTSYSGMRGVSQFLSVIFTTCSTCDILQIGGTSGNPTYYNNFDHFAISRATTNPASGTAKGFNVAYISTAEVDHTVSFGSITNYFCRACFGSHLSNNIGTFQMPYTLPAGSYTNFELDSEDGTPENSITLSLNKATGDTNFDSGVTTYGLSIHGKAINDVFVRGFESDRVNYGTVITYSGTGSVGTASDLHLQQMILDGNQSGGISINNVPNSALGSINFNDVWLATNVSGTKSIDLENSFGVNLSNVQVIPSTSNLPIYIHGGGQNTLTNFIVQSATSVSAGTGTGVFLDGSNNNLITGVHATTTNTLGQLFFMQNNASNNMFVGNTITGVTNYCLAMGDAGSVSGKNTALGNTCTGTLANLFLNGTTSSSRNYPGFTGTATSGTCVLTLTDGLVAGTAGC